jgi:hypothetical protein
MNSKKRIMKRELIKTLPYDKVDFRWISSHYDVHLKGSCMINGSLHEFENDHPEDDKEMMVRIYKLDLISKLKWYWMQWCFEKCVGYHWTYPQRKQGQRFYYRKPKWLYVRIFNWYYKR